MTGIYSNLSRLDVEDIKKNGEFLGFCPLKGYIYSVPTGNSYWKIVALKNGRVETLIRFKGVDITLKK